MSDLQFCRGNLTQLLREENIIEISDFEDNLEESGETQFPTIIDLDDSDDEVIGPAPSTHVEHVAPQHAQLSSSTGTAINPELPPVNVVKRPWEEIDSWPLEDDVIKRGVCVELASDGIYKSGSTFLLVKMILQNTATGKIQLRGISLQRNSLVKCMPMPQNDVCMVIKMALGDLRSCYEQEYDSVSLEKAVKLRKVIFTHKSIEDEPGHRKHAAIYEALPKHERNTLIRDKLELVCRFVVVKMFDSLKALTTAWKEMVIRRLVENESPFTPRSEWKPAKRSLRGTRGPLVKVAKNTYVSCFCCGGGDATGAKNAGASVAYAFDMDGKALATFRINHPTTIAEARSVDDVIRGSVPDIGTVIILHASPPCQPWSPLQRTPGKRNDENMDALSCVLELLQKFKPWYYTMEETDGLAKLTKHRLHFLGLLNDVVKAGYNIRIGRRQFMGYGLPSSRTRLVMIAGRVGLPLPNFPEYTHGPGTPKRYRTIRDAIATVPRNAPRHLGSVSNFPRGDERQPYDPDLKKALCITCTVNTRDVYHPSGLRPFTVAELAVLNGFPPGYRFPSNATAGELISHIGNAVPPIVWNKVIKAILTTKKDWCDGLIDELGYRVPNQQASQGDSVPTALSQANVRNAFGPTASRQRSPSENSSITLQGITTPRGRKPAGRRVSPAIAGSSTSRNLRTPAGQGPAPAVTPIAARHKQSKKRSFVDLLEDELYGDDDVTVVETPSKKKTRHDFGSRNLGGPRPYGYDHLLNRAPRFGSFFDKQKTSRTNYNSKTSQEEDARRSISRMSLAARERSPRPYSSNGLLTPDRSNSTTPKNDKTKHIDLTGGCVSDDEMMVTGVRKIPPPVFLVDDDN